MLMQMRYLGRSGLQVSALSFSAMTCGGVAEPFASLGPEEGGEARRLIDICLDAGVNLFDASDISSAGRTEEILGAALGSRRDEVLLATRLRFATGPVRNDAGLSRHHLIRACEGSLRRLATDHIDLLQLHEIDAATPLDETLRALDDLVRAGKVRYIGCSNFSAWLIMKTLGISEARGWERFVAHQAYYSLVGRDLELDLIPLAMSEGLGHLVWSPPLAGGSDEELGSSVVAAAAAIAESRGASIAQVSINWLLSRPSVTSVIIGARGSEQLLDRLNAASWELTAEEAVRLDAASPPRVTYPHWHQRGYAADRQVGPNRVAITVPDLDAALQ
jgi:aryl-alcohol dehydrogenase-like predicted oxidoreductase